jgi:hypothetical protein
MKYIYIIFTLLIFSPDGNASKVSSITVPDGFERIATANNSYAEYLRSLPIKTDKKILLWNGNYLPINTYEQIAVVDLPLLFDQDLEQCADFSMRFWAEYLRKINALDKLSLYDFYGNRKPFSKSGKSFRDYLHWHMSYSNSYSLKLGAKKVSLLSELRAGDMFVQNDSEEGIGHVSVVIDEAENSFGQKVYLVGYSYMPAQQFHIEKADQEHGLNGWFTADGYRRYALEMFGAFGAPVLMRF